MTDRVTEVNRLRQLAADLYDNDRSGGPAEGQTPEEYAEELIRCFDADKGLDAHDAALLRRFLAEMAAR